ncbi:xylulokinase [Salsuginibacillus kocurii]|uniref:xylulokinase n=1 Tax=Salsuginibacillus kocurii TaxID=427078 RepID=UPI00036AD199|nr:FGGY family carbohydrate kinase [Salsuginibacillus kocurii]
MSHIVGIDIGTSGIKIGMFDRHGSFQFYKYQSYELLFEQNRVELDLEDIWQVISGLLIETGQEVERLGGTVEGISISSFCHASVFLNQEGTPLMNGIMYMDRRGEEEVNQLESALSPQAKENVQNRIDPGMSSVTNLMWVRNHLPHVYEQTAYWGHLSSFILYKLTNQFVMDWTQASFTGIFNIETYNWSQERLTAAGIPSNLLPEVVDPAKKVGHVASLHPTIDGAMVVAGAADTACSSLAIGLKPQEMFESVGTSNVLTVCTDNPKELDTRMLNRCHVIKNEWLSHGPMSTPGASIAWFYNEFLKNTEHGSKDRVLEEYSKSSAPGASGVFFLPYMLGERAPIWDGDARGVFFGLHLNTSKADMLQAIYEGCSYGLKQIYDIINTNYNLKDPHSFCSIGGGSKNVHWAQTKATILNANINVKNVSETAVIGCCLLAAKALGYISSFEESSFQLKNSTYKTIKPKTELQTFYQDLYQFFCEIYPTIKPLYRKHSLVYAEAEKTYS